MEIITVPFGWLLNFLYQFTGSYGLSLILFAILVPITLSTSEMTRIWYSLSRVSRQTAF